MNIRDLIRKVLNETNGNIGKVRKLGNFDIPPFNKMSDLLSWVSSNRSKFVEALSDVTTNAERKFNSMESLIKMAESGQIRADELINGYPVEYYITRQGGLRDEFVRLLKIKTETKFFFPKAHLESSDESFFYFRKLSDYEYQPIAFEYPKEYFEYVNSLKPADRDTLNFHMENLMNIDVTGEFNKINFREGIPELLRGTGFGYKIYEDLIKFKKFASSYGSVTDDAKNIWKKISKDPDFYSVRYKDGSTLAIYKKWDGDIVKKIKEFISFQGRKEIDHISDTLLSDFPEFNKYL